MNTPSQIRYKPRALVTAVLVCWNHEQFVRDAVTSVIEQTYKNIQLIVFDNGSTDGSRAVLQQLRAEHEFTLIFQDNIGLVKTLNRALTMAEGEFIATLATDDIWLPDKLAAQVAHLQEYSDIHMLGGWYECIDGNGQPVNIETPKYTGETTFKELMTVGNQHLLGPTLMFRVSTLREVGGYDESLRIEDYAIALKLTFRGYRAAVLPKLLAFYRRHETNWTSHNIESELYEIGYAYRHTPEYKSFYRHHFPQSFWRLVKDGHKFKALRLLRTEPVPWTWNNVGRGLMRLLIPYSLIQSYRMFIGKPLNGEPSYWTRPGVGDRK